MDHAERARRIATDLDDTRTELHAATTVANALLFSGRTSEGWDLGSETIRRSRAAQLEVEASWAYRILGSSGSEVVDYERAERIFREGIDTPSGSNAGTTAITCPPTSAWSSGPWAGGTKAGTWPSRLWSMVSRGSPLGSLRPTCSATSRWVAAAGSAHGGRSRHRSSSANRWARSCARRWPSGASQRRTCCPAIHQPPSTWAERGVADSERVGDAALLFPFLVTGTRALLAAGDLTGAKRWVARLEPRLRRTAIAGTLPAIDHGLGLVLAASGSSRSGARGAGDVGPRLG